MHLMRSRRGQRLLMMHPLSDEDDIAEGEDEADKHGSGTIIIERSIQDENVTMTRLSFAAVSNCLTISWQEQKCLKLFDDNLLLAV